jgi:predicted nucleic acid-binding protein
VIVLDTNVLSALMQRQPDPVVVAWLDRQPSESVWTTAITVFEIQFGLELLAAGRRRHQLEDAFRRALAEDFENRILPFDEQAAREAAGCAAQRKAAGRVVDFRDVEIAGIIAARRAILATRNLRHFRDLGIAVVDPWTGTTV